MKGKSSTVITRVVIFFIIYFILFAILRDLTKSASIFAVAIAFFSSKLLAKELNKNSSSNDKKE